MAKSKRYEGSVDWMDAEFGDEIKWNDAVAGQQVAMLHNKRVLFGEITQNEHLRNCHMLHIAVEDVVHYDDVSPARRSEKLASFKRLPSSRVYLWKFDLKSGRSRRAFMSQRGQGTQASFLDDSFKAQAEKRKAYAAHRNHLSQARHQVHTAFEVLGLQADASLQDLKSKRKELLSIYHPDLLQVFMSKGGAEEDFLSKSKQITDAIADAKEYIERRDATQQVYDQFTQNQGE